MFNNNIKVSQEEILSELSLFCGTQEYHRYSGIFPQFLLTDGCKHMAKKLQCFWLFDFIASHQANPLIRDNQKLQRMQFWQLDKKEDGSASILCEWDRGETVLSETIPYTDFLLDSVRVWVSRVFVNEETSVTDARYMLAMLPSEY